MLAVGREATARDQQMDMRVIAQGTVPGMEHGQQTRQGPEQAFAGTEFQDRLRRHLHQQAVQQLLLPTEQGMQRGRDGHHGVKIIAGQQFGLALLQPLLRLRAMAFRAGPVAAAVKAPEDLMTLVTVVQPSSQGGGTTSHDVRQGLFLRGHQRRAVLGQVVRAETADDVGQLQADLGLVGRGINHGWASFLRRDPRWSGPAGGEVAPVTAR